MNDFPREMRQGDVVSATEYNRLVRCLRRLAIIQGPGVKLSFRPNGTVVSAAVPARNRAPAPSAPRPWTFSVESSGTGSSTTFTAKWNDGAVQYGYQVHGIGLYNGNPVNGPDLATGGAVSWSAATLDALAASVVGNHWLQMNLKAGEYSIVVLPPNSAAPQDDLVNSIVNVWIGTVEAETDEDDNVTALKQTCGIYTVPVLYKYV